MIANIVLALEKLIQDHIFSYVLTFISFVYVAWKLGSLKNNNFKQ